MADTTNVGEIAVEIVAKTEKLEAGMKSAGTTVNSFSEKASKSLSTAGESFTKFEVSGRAGKRVITDLAVSAGGAAGPFGNLAGSIIKMGPALGIAVAGFEIYNQVMGQSSKNAADAAKNAEAFAEIAEQVGKITGEIPKEGMFSQAVTGEIKNITKELTELHKQYDENTGSLAIATPDGLRAQKALNAEIASTTDKQMKLLKVVQEFKGADAAAGAFKETEYDIKIHTNKDSVDRAQQEIAGFLTYNQGLKDSLNTLPPGGTAYNAILDKWRENYVKIIDLQDEIAAKQKKITDENHKALDKGINSVGKLINEQRKKDDEAELKAAEKMNDELNKTATEIQNAILTPSEILANKIKLFQDLMAKGLLNPDEVARATALAKGVFDKASQKELVKTGFAQQLDTSRVSAAAMRMADTKVQKVTDPALELTNQYLKTISTGFSQPQPAVTS